MRTIKLNFPHYIPLIELDATEHPMSVSAISQYRGVLVLWDEDKNPRLITLIDSLSDAERDALVAVHEHEGTVTFIWGSGSPPFRLVDDIMISGEQWETAHLDVEGTEP